jgi:hypothetical protein
MSFSINEKTVYIKPIVSAQNVFGRAFSTRQTRQFRDIKQDTKFFHPESRRDHYFGQDKLVDGDYLEAKGRNVKLYYNLNDRLTQTQTNYCKILENPSKIWNRTHSSDHVFNYMVDTNRDPRFDFPSRNLGSFTSIYRKSR